ncbi:hypothetical protein BN439_0509 [Erwinia amylovora Ea644]|nr:hypothetical protein BN439_0509 [Erwinia amylovora Ea644]CCP05593.1 hypothetical protein BN440_0541 [Erwinia amylovora MR1]
MNVSIQSLSLFISQAGNEFGMTTRHFYCEENILTFS